jgi:hypothetical protein
VVVNGVEEVVHVVLTSGARGGDVRPAREQSGISGGSSGKKRRWSVLQGADPAVDSRESPCSSGGTILRA